MATDLRGRKVIITGAAGGIGAGAVEAFAAAGAKIVALRNRTDPPENLLKRATWMSGDLSDKAVVDRLFGEAISTLGGLDVLIHPAGTWRASTPETMTGEELDFLIAANLKSTVFTNQAAFREMKERGGRIINFGSQEGVVGNPKAPQYATVRGAVHSWTRSAARAWGQYGITVNAVAPAAKSALADYFFSTLSKEEQAGFAEHLRRQIPIFGRLGDPLQDIAPVLLFLASDASHFMTGQLVPVDGGLMMLGA